MTTFARVLAIVVCGAVLTTLTPAQDKDKAKPPTKPAAAPAAKAEVFVIAKNGDKFEVMNKADIEAKNKQLASEFEKANAEFEKAKKAAEAAKKKFDQPKPVKATLEIQAGEFTTKDAAEAALKKMKDDKAKAHDKAKDEPKKADDPKKGKDDKKGGGH